MAVRIGIYSLNNPTTVAVTIVVDSYNTTTFYFTSPKDNVTDYEVEEVITVDIDEVEFSRFKVFKGIHAVHLVKGDIEVFEGLSCGLKISVLALIRDAVMLCPGVYAEVPDVWHLGTNDFTIVTGSHTDLRTRGESQISVYVAKRVSCPTLRGKRRYVLPRYKAKMFEYSIKCHGFTQKAVGATVSMRRACSPITNQGSIL